MWGEKDFIMKKYNIKASFFLMGKSITEETVKYAEMAYAMGCELCNHSENTMPKPLWLLPKYIIRKPGSTISEVTSPTKASLPTWKPLLRPAYQASNYFMASLGDNGLLQQTTFNA